MNVFYGDGDEAAEQDGLLIPDFFRELTSAIDRANGVRAELAAKTPGYLAAYIEHARVEAAEALATLLTTAPDNVNAIHQLQTVIAAYRSVTIWTEGVLEDGRTAEQEWAIQYARAQRGEDD